MEVPVSSYNYTAPTVIPLEDVDVFTNASISENLRILDIQDLTSAYLYLLKKFLCLDDNAFKAKFRSFNPVFISQLAEDVQDTDYDKIEVFVFCYLTTLIPRNHSANFKKYQLNKVQGLKRAVDSFCVFNEANYIVDQLELSVLRAFCDRHYTVLESGMRLLLGFANPNEANMITTFAVELLDSIEYVYMLGIKLTETFIVIPKHACLSCQSVNAHMEIYDNFKRDRQLTFGMKGWKYSAMLGRASYQDYAKSESFKFLYVLSACIASETKASYKRLTIDRISISDHMMTNPYKQILRLCNNVSDTLIVQNRFTSNDAVNALKNKISAWTNNYNNNPASSINVANDDASSMAQGSQFRN